VADRVNYGIMIFPRRAIETRRVAERAEALGFSWLGIADSPTVYQESYLHQLEALHVTRRLIVGPVATHVTLRHPLIVGNLLATLMRSATAGPSVSSPPGTAVREASA
jgi:5,10-methylenetetrahydromethanopterin reductase